MATAAPVFAKWYADRIKAITSGGTGLIPQVTGLDTSGAAPPWSFTFNEAVFAAQLSTIPITTSQVTGVTNFANAWETAILASLAAVGPGCFIPPSSPATLFSAVAGVVIDPASVALGKAKIIELGTSPLVASAQDSEFPIKFREATLLLTVTVSGTDSDDSGPLVAPTLAME